MYNVLVVLVPDWHYVPKGFGITDLREFMCNIIFLQSHRKCFLRCPTLGGTEDNIKPGLKALEAIKKYEAQL